MNFLIAGFTIKINFLSPGVLHYKTNFKESLLKSFQDFLIYSRPNKIDYTINITAQMCKKVISRQNNFYLNIYRFNSINTATTFYWISMLEFKVLFMSIIQLLLKKNDDFFLHASASIINNKAHVFLGLNGAGKSTITDLLSAKYKKFADDSLIVRKEGNNYFIYQLPTSGKQYTKKTKKGYPIKQIYFICKAKCFQIQPLQNRGQILSLLTKQLIIDGNITNKHMKYLFNIISSELSFYWFNFVKDGNKLIDFMETHVIDKY